MLKIEIGVLGILILFVLTTVVEVHAGSTNEPEVIKDVNKEFGISTYVLAQDQCVIMLMLGERSNKKDFFIRDLTESSLDIKQTSSCSYSRRMQLTEKVLARIAKDTDNLKRVKCFSPKNMGAEPMYRLASAAAKSPEWDRKRGRPESRGKKIGTEWLIKKYIQENNVFKELSDIFGKYHLKLKAGDVERALVPQVKNSRIADYAKRPNSPISPEDKLPMSASIMLVVEPQ